MGEVLSLVGERTSPTANGFWALTGVPTKLGQSLSEQQMGPMENEHKTRLGLDFVAVLLGGTTSVRAY